MFFKRIAVLFFALSLTACVEDGDDGTSDELISAQDLKVALETFVAAPTDANLALAKKSWLGSRESYGQSEPLKPYQVSGDFNSLRWDNHMTAIEASS